jgi:hypothetical protein
VCDPALRSAATALTDADQLVVTLAHLAWPLACLGYLHQARARREAAIAEARLLGHAFTLAFALAFAAGWGLYGAEEALQAETLWAEELLALSTEHGFAFFKTMGTIHRGRCLAMEGRAAEGIAQMTEGLAAFRSTGAVSFLPRFLILIAEAYGRARQPLVGLEHLTEVHLSIPGPRGNPRVINNLNPAGHRKGHRSPSSKRRQPRACRQAFVRKARPWRRTNSAIESEADAQASYKALQ